MGPIEASCVLYVEVGTLNWLEPCTISLLTVNELGIVTLTVHHDIIFSLCFIWDPRDSWDNHQQTSFPMKNGPFVPPNDDISPVVHLYLSLQTHTHHCADWVQIAWQWAICLTCSYAQQNSSCVELPSWLLQMPFCLEANNIFLRSSHFISLSSSSGPPSSFCYHYLFTATAANHGSTNTSPRWEWNRI